MFSVVHIVASLSRLAGGISQVVTHLATIQQEQCIMARIVCLADQYTTEDCCGEISTIMSALAVVGPRAWGYSPDMSRYLYSLGNTVDIIHSHGLWMYPSYLARLFSQKTRIPLIVAPHGMLEPWCLQHSRFKKQLALSLFERKNLEYAHCIHAMSTMEAENIRSFGLMNPIAVVPPGLDVASYGLPRETTRVLSDYSIPKVKKLLLFVSRIHPKKGLVCLAQAWGRLCQRYQDWHLVIAGPDENGHRTEVEKVITDVGASRQTTIVGSVHGEVKRLIYAACDVFVLPTFSENFGIVVAEALASGKPVITTRGTPWSELETHRCGWYIDVGVEPLCDVLREAMNLSDKERDEMGKRGRRLIEKNYSWPKIAAEMLKVYSWILCQGDKPDCVRLD